MPAISSLLTASFIRASSAWRPSIVKPTLTGSATAATGHAGSRDGSTAATAGLLLLQAARAVNETTANSDCDPVVKGCLNIYPLFAIARVYLAGSHRDNPGAGCLLAALGPDVSRQGPAVRNA